MKLGYRERVVLIIVLIVAIFGLGIFVFIKPQWEKLNDNKKRRDDLKSAWDSKLVTFEGINKTQKNIRESVEEGRKTAQKFTGEMNSIELAKFLQDKFINTDKNTEDEVSLKGTVSVSDPGTSSLNYYYYRPNVVTYPLYENADLDGSLAEALSKKMEEANTFALHSAQTAGSSTASFTMLINREDTMAFLDAIYDHCKNGKETMMIESVTLKDCNFNEDYEEGEEQQQQAAPPADNEEGDEEEGEAAPPANDEEKNKVPAGVKPGYTEVSVAYRVFYMQEPTDPELGPEYKSTIWDGDEWRDPAPAK